MFVGLPYVFVEFPYFGQVVLMLLAFFGTRWSALGSTLHPGNVILTEEAAASHCSSLR